jgi:hypothetical protein
MRLSNKTRHAAFVLAFCLPGCAYVSNFFSDDPRGPGEVNDLNGSIERVYVDAELARTNVRDSVASLESIAGGSLGEDPAATYAAFVERLDQSEAQAKRLRGSIGPMNSNAERVFKQWEQDLRAMTSPSLLQRSRARLDATRARYEQDRVAAESAHKELVEINRSMRDHALFLGHDLNADSLEAVKADVRKVAEDSGTLDASLARCMESARAYVAASAVKADMPAADEATVAKGEASESDPKVEKVANTQYVR